MAFCDKDCFNCKYDDCRCPEAEAAVGLNTDIYIRATRIAPKRALEDLTPLEQERRLKSREATKRWRERQKGASKNGTPRRRGRPPKEKADE